jgi:hypothetical protein
MLRVVMRNIAFILVGRITENFAALKFCKERWLVLLVEKVGR